MYVNACRGGDRRCWQASKKFTKWTLPWRTHQDSGTRGFCLLTLQNPAQEEMSVKGTSVWRAKDVGISHFQMFGFSFLAS